MLPAMRGSTRNLDGLGVKGMWYFSWILGIGVALGFGIINVMWLDINGKFTNGHGPGPGPTGPDTGHPGHPGDGGVQPGEAPRP